MKVTVASNTASNIAYILEIVCRLDSQIKQIEYILETVCRLDSQIKQIEKGWFTCRYNISRTLLPGPGSLGSALYYTEI